jgi:hypothetical protein
MLDGGFSNNASIIYDAKIASIIKGLESIANAVALSNHDDNNPNNKNISLISTTFFQQHTPTRTYHDGNGRFIPALEPVYLASCSSCSK